MAGLVVAGRAAAVLMVMAGAASADAGASQPARESAFSWRFDAGRKWNGWAPNQQIQDVRFEDDCVSFETVGGDPALTSPVFDWPTATNGQRVEVEIDCEGAGEGELFFTNTTEGVYNGFDAKWHVPAVVPAAGRQWMPIWPFWETLGHVIRLRFDPPSGMRCRLYGIRIVADASLPGKPEWTFGESKTSWQPMYATRVEPSSSGLRVQALRPMALVATSVEPFAAEGRSVLRMEAACPGEHSVCFYWATREQPGLWGEVIDLPAAGEGPIVVDLRQYAAWKGTITNLAIGFGTHGRETLTLRSLAIGENDPQQPFLRLRYFGYATGIARPGAPVELKALLEHAAGAAMPAGEATLDADENASCPEPRVPVARMAPGDRVELRGKVVPRSAGAIRVKLSVNGQGFTRVLRVDPEVGKIARGEYDVPEPRPVKTDYEIGIYYYPGWSPDRMGTWKRQAETPERDSLLGWYEEGRPEVADWHIKWAVENGISFFVYDWYWRDGKEDLGPALNEGFLKARYNDRMKFAVMWANHKPFSSHTREQLLTVADYWIEKYLRRPNYWKVDGKPYVSFFSPQELLRCFGTAEKVSEALEATRERVRSAGLPGLHIGAIETSGQLPYATLKAMGFDSFTGYNYVRTGTTVSHSLYRQYLIGCRAKWEQARRANALAYIPLMGVGWDGPAWYGPRSERRRGRRTEDLVEGLGQLKAYLDEIGQKTAILEAWNEWGEGSYLEPNLEFGFGDVEAVRRVFAQPGDWCVNVGPEDVGLGGAYDLRNKPAGCRAAAGYGAIVEIAGANPAVGDGLKLRCWENRIAIDSGTVRIHGQEIKSPGGCVTVPDAATRAVELPIVLKAGEVNRWLGGNRLVVAPDDRWRLLPGSYVAGSLRVIDPADPGAVFESKRDYVVDDTWGAFAWVEGGRLKEGQHVVARYEMSLRRIDALVMDHAGRLSVIPGGSEAKCPEPPAIPKSMLHLVSIYRPFGAKTVRPEHVYVVTGEHPDLSPIRGAASLGPVLAKLREGKNVTVVCWGDSVTHGGDASSPAKSYVGQFEAMLKQRFPKASVRVVNAGIGGSSTFSRLPNFQAEVLDHKPDLVTLEFVNDMGAPVEQLRTRYAEVLRRVREAGAALIILTPHFTMPSMMNLPDGRGRETRAAVTFLREFAAGNDVPLADASRRWELLEKMGVPYETLLRNGINHPDDRGHLIFAEELMRFFPAE